MRPFEIILVVMLLINLGSTLIPANKRPRWLLFLPSLTLLIAIVQLIAEQYRWQMLPAYLLTVVFFLISLVLLRRRPAATTAPARWTGRIARIAGIAVVFLLWVVAVALPGLIPVWQLPDPTGPYAIGTHTFEWVDDSRSETFSSDPNSHRDLVVQVWYPAEKLSGVKPITYPSDARYMMRLPSGSFDHFGLVATHSYPDAPVAQAQTTYPVLIFSHGYGLILKSNTIQMEELASQGYVVFSIAHPYESAATVYPDGRVVPLSDVIIERSNSDADAVQAALDQYKQAADAQTSEVAIRQYYGADPTLQASPKIWTDDTVFVLDEIEKLNRGELPSLLSSHLDLNQIGLFGHSFGGATAGEVCAHDKRCKAGVNMDGPQWGDVLDQPISQPFMMMYSDHNPAWITNRSGQTMNDVIYSRGHNPFYRVTVKDTSHYNYTDMSLFSPLLKMTGVLGGIDGYRMETILNHYLAAFFNKYLKDSDSPVLDGPDPLYPEVAFQVRQP